MVISGTSPAQYRIALIIWGAAVVTVVLLNAVGTFLAFGGEYEPMLMLVVVLNTVGCVAAGLSFAVPRAMRTMNPTCPVLTLSVIRTAIAESAGLIAFVTTFIAGPVPGGTLALAASLLALWVAYPRLDEWQRAEADSAATSAGDPPIVSG